MKRLHLSKLHTALIICAMIFSLTGCGSDTTPDLTNPELSYLRWKNESILEESSIRYTSKEENLGMEYYDQYYYELEDSNGSTEKIVIYTYKNEVTYISLSKDSYGLSDYTIYGIHIGDTKDKAKKLARQVYNDPGYDVPTTEYDCVMFGMSGHERGLLTLNFDSQTGNVSMIIISKNQ